LQFSVKQNFLVDKALSIAEGQIVPRVEHCACHHGTTEERYLHLGREVHVAVFRRRHEDTTRHPTRRISFPANVKEQQLGCFYVNGARKR
jgi:hypothetical protein